MRYQCIIFDCDGVLVDSEEISSRVLIEMASEIGVAISMDFAEENFTGKSLKNCLDYIESQLEQNLPPRFEDNYRERSYAFFDMNELDRLLS